MALISAAVSLVGAVAAALLQTRRGDGRDRFGGAWSFPVAPMTPEPLEDIMNGPGPLMSAPAPIEPPQPGVPTMNLLEQNLLKRRPFGRVAAEERARLGAMWDDYERNR